MNCRWSQTYNDGERSSEVVQQAPFSSQFLGITQFCQTTLVLDLEVDMRLVRHRDAVGRFCRKQSKSDLDNEANVTLIKNVLAMGVSIQCIGITIL